MIICCCKEAKKDCEKTCPKGLELKPEKVFVIPTWRKHEKDTSNSDDDTDDTP